MDPNLLSLIPDAPINKSKDQRMKEILRLHLIIKGALIERHIITTLYFIITPLYCLYALRSTAAIIKANIKNLKNTVRHEKHLIL